MRNEAEFTALACAFQDDIFRLALGYLKSYDAADDVTQEVLIALYRSDKEFENDQHADGYVTICKCLNEYTVAEGDTVSQGQQLGAVGSTGHSTGPHLHFELRQNGTPIDPALYFTD